MRAIFGYGVPHTGQEWSYESPLNHPEDARRVRTQYFSSDQQRVTMAMALRGPEFSTMDVTRHDWKLARDLGLPISVHVGSGPFGVPYRAIERLSQDHLLGPDTQYVHTTTLTDEAIQLLAESGGTAVVTPAVEMQMGFGLPATHRLMAHGIRPGLGVDIVTSTAGDLFTQMRAAFQVARLQALQEGSSSPTVEDIFALATIDGARASWLDQKIGTLTPGKQADIILLTTNTLNLTPLNDPVASVVLGAHAGNVDTVLVAGKTLKQGGRLLHIDLEQIRAQATASRDYLMEASGFSKTV
jgi:cytosine/adenosine deaminase-related metal-dependent hydrolase